MVNNASQLVEHFFRYESGNLVSVLTRVFGLANLQLVEDTVQSALIEALEHWKINGPPKNPAAWIHRVARNKALDALRRQKTETRYFEQMRDETTNDSLSVAEKFDSLFAPAGITDSLLRMMFACSHPGLDRHSQIAITLKLLCGFSYEEVASALLISSEGARKRIYRAKQQIAESNIPFEIPEDHSISERIGAVNEVLYLMFNEGYSSSSGEHPIREELCEEAARLCHLLCESPLLKNHSEKGGATRALLSLMLYHAARFGSRTGADGSLVLLKDQDRTKWERGLMEHADHWLMKSAGPALTTFHVEAAIAQLHCRAASFEETNWPLIVKLYDKLVEINPTPIYSLNRAVAIGQSGDIETAIAELNRIADDPRLQNYFLLDCALAELYLEQGSIHNAQAHWEKALKSAHSKHETRLITDKLKQLAG